MDGPGEYPRRTFARNAARAMAVIERFGIRKVVAFGSRAAATPGRNAVSILPSRCRMAGGWTRWLP